MELNELYGATLVEIHRKHKEVELVFQGRFKTSRLMFEGFFFETEISGMDMRVKRVSISSMLGMKALDLLRYYNYSDKFDFRQIFIEFEGSAFKKNEIYCVCKNFLIK